MLAPTFCSTPITAAFRDSRCFSSVSVCLDNFFNFSCTPCLTREAISEFLSTVHFRLLGHSYFRCLVFDVDPSFLLDARN